MAKRYGEYGKFGKGFIIVGYSVLGLLMFVLIAGIVGSCSYQPPQVAVEQQTQATRDYIKDLRDYAAVTNNSFANGFKMAQKGDIQGAYLNLKTSVKPLVESSTVKLSELIDSVPEVKDKKLLQDAGYYFLGGISSRKDAINLFSDAVENNKTGKVYEAAAKAKEADAYFAQAEKTLQSIESKLAK